MSETQNLWNITRDNPRPVHEQISGYNYVYSSDRTFPDLQPGFRDWDRERFTYPHPSHFYVTDALRASNKLGYVTPMHQHWHINSILPSVGTNPPLIQPSTLLQYTTPDGILTGQAQVAQTAPYLARQQAPVLDVPDAPPAPAVPGAPPPPAGDVGPAAGGGDAEAEEDEGEDEFDWSGASYPSLVPTRKKIDSFILR